MANYKFCPECGGSLNKDLYCEKCGATYDNDLIFIPKSTIGLDFLITILKSILILACVIFMIYGIYRSYLWYMQDQTNLMSLWLFIIVYMIAFILTCFILMVISGLIRCIGKKHESLQILLFLLYGICIIGSWIFWIVYVSHHQYLINKTFDIIAIILFFFGAPFATVCGAVDIND